MTIAEVREKCKGTLAKIPRDILVIAIIFFASSASFGLGYLAGIDMGQGSTSAAYIPSSLPRDSDRTIVASKNGTKYYLSGCAGAQAISEANKVWFVSAFAAEAAGYTPAANCKGI